MNLSKLIYKTLEQQTDEPRPYIGASSIGNPCERAIWYGLHRTDAKVVDAKLRMTFQIGKRLEQMLLDLIPFLSLPINKSFHEKTYPLFQGTVDAIIYKNNEYDFILEIKTANNSSFDTFKKKGLRLWNSQYYDQVQSYMGMSGVHKCYLLALNKNTSELHDEFVLFDEDRYMSLVTKAKRIGEAVTEPPRISGSASFYLCKMCFYKGVCHK